MRRYSPSEKLSDEYLATERKTLEGFLLFAFNNSYKTQVLALKQIEDRYEQLKEIVRLQDTVRSWLANESFAKDCALSCLEMLELAGSDKEHFIKLTDSDEFFYRAQMFFEDFKLFKTFPEYWHRKNNYRDRKDIFRSFYLSCFSEETIKEILQIGDKFSANLWKRDFVLIEASKLSLNDVIFQHDPQNEKERIFRKRLEAVIKSGIKDFWKSQKDPTVIRMYDKQYLFVPDDYYFGHDIPMKGNSYRWWEETTAKKNCRLGKKSEYIAFLGVLLKKLVESGWSLEKAWYAVCVDSSELGQYKTYENHFWFIIWNGTKKICGFYDLANTRKLLAEDEDSGCFACWHASGHCGELGTESPLATLRYDDERNCNHPNSVGWIVRDVE